MLDIIDAIAHNNGVALDLVAADPACSAERGQVDEARSRLKPNTPQIAAVEPPKTNPPAEPPQGSAPPPINAADVQRELQRVGCYSGALDGNWKAASTQTALAEFRKYASISKQFDAPSDDLMQALKGRPSRVCPPTCSVKETLKDGQCVAKTCGDGERLNAVGKCVAVQRRVQQDTRERPQRQQPSAQPKAGNHCFTAYGRTYCE
ncbi:MAG: hypothetical protein P4L98_11960 [Ancalomicrobiaceae bacterium]|nr:hypothetical protein [Ancalomicrobiaceae bacterium]